MTGPIPFTVLNAAAALVIIGFFVLRQPMSKRLRRYRQVLDAGTNTDSAGVAEFPIRSAATRAGLLHGGYSKNSINPRFWIDPDAVRIRILKDWRAPFADIRQIDARKTLTGVILVFQIEAGNRVFIARFGDSALARSALLLVPAPIPLTTRAAILRDGEPSKAAPGMAYHSPF